MEIGQQVRQWRASTNMSLSELQRRTGISKGHLSQIERGLTQPSFVLVETVAAVFGLSVAFVFSDADVADNKFSPMWERDLADDEPTVRMAPVDDDGRPQELPG